MNQSIEITDVTKNETALTKQETKLVELLSQLDVEELVNAIKSTQNGLKVFQKAGNGGIVMIISDAVHVISYLETKSTTELKCKLTGFNKNEVEHVFGTLVPTKQDKVTLILSLGMETQLETLGYWHVDG